VSIVSNNSVIAVERYLDLHHLGRHIDAGEGRTSEGVGHMKPDPALVRQALDRIEAAPRTAVLIGNSPSDVAAARNAGVEAIGFVDRPAKRGALATATALVTNLADLVDALTGV
jgi:phosphoglycolate phosphatase